MRFAAPVVACNICDGKPPLPSEEMRMLRGFSTRFARGTSRPSFTAAGQYRRLHIKRCRIQFLLEYQEYTVSLSYSVVNKNDQSREI